MENDNGLYNVGWGFTKACNLNCKHCYNSSGGKRGLDELTLEEARGVVDKLADNGIQTINYGTGESGLVPEFWRLVEYVRSKGIVQGLTTSGWSVNPHTIDDVARFMNDVDVSVDYANEANHNWFRDNRNSWKWAMRALDLLKEREVDCSIVACLTAKNCYQENLDGLLDLARKYDCDLRVNWFKPTGRGKTNDDLTLSIEQVNETFRYLVETCVIKALPDPYFSATLGLNSREGCPCGKDSFRITPNGQVVPCVYFTKEMENVDIRENEFEEIVNSKPFRDINNRELSFCNGCEYLSNCQGGCASRAFLEHGTMDAPDAFCYKVAGMENNPFADLEFEYRPEGLRVHENYLCTAIFKPK